MPNSKIILAPGKIAVIAGILYLFLISSGIFAEFVVRSGLVVSGDAAATADNIRGNTGWFRLSVVGDLIMIICDITLALIFYVLFKPVNKALSLLAAFFRLIQASILGVNLLALFVVLGLLSGAGFLSVFNADQLDALALMFTGIHGIGYSIGLVFFAMSLFVLGILIYRSGYIPKILGIMLLVAAFGYLFDSFAQVLLQNYSDYETLFGIIVFAPAFIAELSLCVWLIVQGLKIKIEAIA
jgi:hypothetical protein